MNNTRNFPMILVVTAIAALLLMACGAKTPASLNQAGNQAFADAQYDTALTSYQQVAQVDPALPQAQYNIGNTQFRMNAMDAAREALSQAATQLSAGESRLPTAFAEQTSFNLGNVHFATEDFESAIEAYKAALRMNPNDQDAKVNLELALRKQKEKEEDQPEEPTPTPSPTPEPSEPTPTPTPEEPAGEGTPTPTETMLPTETPTPTPNPGEGEGETPTPAESGTPEGTPTTEPSPSPASPTPQSEQPAQPTLMPGELSPEQAARILEAAADQTETLQERLQRNQPVSKEDVDKDW